ncbi:MAG: quinone-dependent dihydroorotate dehydrogenase [Bacteroidota bacterium]
MYKVLIRPLLFLLDAEKAHNFSFKSLKLLLKLPFAKSITKSQFASHNNSLSRTIKGLTFKNPIGLAAGFDKNAKMIEEFETFGFGFVEIGTVTPKPQAGNDKPRLFRLPIDKSLINRMGFNNDGADAIVERLKQTKTDVIIGGNIGKNKVTPNENALDDYLICFDKLFDHVDYFVVNVSSPNTPGLRALQEKEPLKRILNELQKKNLDKASPKPLLLKIAPDLTDSQLEDIIELTNELNLDGLIATNTTISRDQLTTSKKEIESIGAGGLSGKVLKARSTEVIQYLRKGIGSEKIIIGVGGIFNADDAKEKLKAGADLIQVYTGFVYEGPSMIKKILSDISK